MEYSLEYNSSRPPMKLMEYGRNVQKIVEAICKVPEKEKRTQMAYTLIHLMKQLNPSVRENQDNPQRIWDHLYYLSDFKLDIDGPFPMPAPEHFIKPPKKVAYPQRELKFKHYGKQVLMMMEEASKIEDEEEKKYAFIKIGKLMKVQYITWANKDISDDQIILDHLQSMAAGMIDLREDFKNNPRLFDSESAVLAKSEQNTPPQHHSGGKKRRKKRRK